ncbi:MAG: putative DNA binding domain-containing protein [Nitrospira sp.]|nr:putative DNA binding domain-containing protein [Nitrospira sp.]
MNYSDEHIVHQLRLGEDSHWEFKQIEFAGNQPKSPSRHDLADEIAAFANSDGGVLLCGVTEKGDVQNLSREQMDELERLLVDVCTDSIKPPIRPIILRRIINERALLLVEVPQGHAQHDSPGGSYHRVGSSKRKMTSDERLRLAQRRGQRRFRSFDELTVPDTGFNTLDESLWKPLLSAEGAANPKAALGKMALWAIDDAGVMRATVAGVLLCTRNPEQWLPNACITATRYRGKDRASGQVDAQDIIGPLNRQVADAVTFAVRNMHVAARKTPARVDLPQYSDKALFEALVNAVAHRDYSMHGSKIRLSMFDDRLEIQSPGSLPNNLTVGSMTTRQATRNEVLTSVLGRMPVQGIRGSEDRQYFMERRGDGVPIILRETRELCGESPEYRLINDSEVCLVIPAAVQEHSPARAVVTVRSAGQPLPDADLLLLFPNKTWKQMSTNEDGEAIVDLHTTHLPMTVFAAALGYAAHLEREWMPNRGSLAIELEALPEGGAVIFPEATGTLPGLKGRLNPIRDTHDRTYLYASNVAINDGQQQPVHFLPGENLRLTDADGSEQLVRIVDIVGRSALLEYRPYHKGKTS